MRRSYIPIHEITRNIGKLFSDKKVIENENIEVMTYDFDITTITPLRRKR